MDRLRDNAAFTYHSGVVVERLEEVSSQVEVTGRNLDGAATFQMRAGKVFVACGVMSTARILLSSLGAFAQPLHALDNCYFLLAPMRWRSRPAALPERLHPLAPPFIESPHPPILPH